MKDEEFYERTKKIEQYYDKEFNDIQLDAWQKNFGELNTTQYDYLIDNIFEQFTYLPKLAQVLELKNKILYETRKKEEQEIKKEKCKKCKGTGLIKYKRTINGIIYDYFARCVCNNGKQYMSFPLITDVIEREKRKTEKKPTPEKIVNDEKKDIKNYLEKIGIHLNEK